MRVFALPALLLALLAAPSTATAAGTHESWATSSIALVTTQGIFPGTAATFQPDQALTAGALAQALGALEARPAATPADPSAPVTVEQLDRTLVDELGLLPAAGKFLSAADSAGLQPPDRFGTEVVARLLGLRTNPTTSDGAFDPQPEQPATRADAAFSAARLLELAQEAASVPGAPASGGALAGAASSPAVAYVAQTADSFTLPTLAPLQQQVLHTAVSLIGYPYAWGGDDEASAPGFDCSGFVWRVYKLASYNDAPQLASSFEGRTAAAMAGGVPRKERISLRDLEPGDVLFFGNGPHSKAAAIYHTGVYLGNGWLIHSSDEGVALAQLDWYRSSFAWARRPLAETGLEPAVPRSA